MPKVRKGKNGKKTKKQAKGKPRKRAEIELPAPMVDIKVKFDPDDLDTAFTYRDAEKVAESERNTPGHQVMSVSEFVRSVRPELDRDIKPKIEPVVKEEPLDYNPDPNPEIDASNSIDDEEKNDEVLNNPTKKKQPDKESTECSICHKSFMNRNSLRKHGRYHKEKTLKCDICDKLFRLKGNLNSHKRTHLPNREKFPCDICQKESSSKQTLKVHRKIHDSSRELFECLICEEKFTLARSLKKHIQDIHENNEKEKCTFCEKEFAGKYYLIVHMRSKHFALLRQQDKGTGDLHEVFKGYRTYECYRCGQNASMRNVKRHIQTCEGKRKVLFRAIKCDLCPNRLTNKATLKKHMRTIHSIHLTTEAIMNVRVEKQHKCIFCDKSFFQRDRQILHIRTEHFDLLRKQDQGTGDLHEVFQGVRTYECYRCKYSTSRNNRFKRHMEKCEDVCIHRPVKCDLCDKRYKNIRNLKYHMRKIHAVYQNELRREQLLKEGGKTFECIDCKAAFIKKKGLMEHIKSYCKKRVFKCDYCSEKFQQQTDKDDHHRLVHSILLQNSHDQTYECDICKKCIPVHMTFNHLAEKHQIKTVFECNIRQLKLYSWNNLNVHILEHETKK